MADVIVRTSMENMDSYEEEDFGIVPLLGTQPAMCSHEIINDCFLGSDATAPSPFFKRRISNESVTCREDNTLTALSDQPGIANSTTGSFADQWFGVDRGSSPTRKFCEGDRNALANNQWGAEESSSTCSINEQLSWIEEWMDMNGIFDPTTDDVSVDIDLPECHQSIVYDQISPETKETTAMSTTQFDEFAMQQQLCPALECNETQQGASFEWGFDAAEHEEAPAVGEKPAVGKRFVAKDFVLRPIPEETARMISPLPLSEQRVRSAKVIKASYAVDNGVIQSKDGKAPLDALGRAASLVTDQAPHEVNRKMSRKIPTSPFISEKKREQNRSAAVRYRDRRREEAKRKKEELHELELRNVALKTQVSGLSKEIGYLRAILNEVLDQ